MKHLLLITLVAVTFLFGNGHALANSVFTDVNSTEVNRLYQNNIVTGYPDNTYRPEQFVTREEAATMIGRALQLNGEQRQTMFPDVDRTSFGSGFIQTAVDRNIITGYPDGTFRPAEPVSREEMAVLLSRAFTFEPSTALPFRDVTTRMYSHDAIQLMAANGITIGYPDGTFRPTQSITRLEFSLFLARALYPEYRAERKAATVSAIATGTVVNAPDGLNVRLGPSTSHQVLGRLPQGTTIQVLEIVNNWALMEHNNLRGYVSLSFLRIQQQATSDALKGKTIVVDPGHGGRDPGAVANGLQEKDVVLAVSLLLRDRLEQAGAKVVMTRATDVFLTLDERVAIANNARAHAFISVHANAATSAATGTETFWNRTHSSQTSKELADKIQGHLIQKLNTRDRGVKEANFRVISGTTMPSVLVELGFITNAAEAERMKTQKFREDSAEAIYLGVIEFFQHK